VTHKPAVVIQEQGVHSFLTATFAFERGEGKVGESCMSQLTVSSTALSVAAPVIMMGIKISFEGSMRPVFLKHQAADATEDAGTGGTRYTKVALRDGSTTIDGRPLSRDPRFGPLIGEANLTFASGTTTVFEFPCPLKEPGDARAVSATFTMSAELFDLDFVVSFDRPLSPVVWWHQKSGKRKIVRVDPHALHIQPRPPKMDMRFIAMQEEYYTDEPITLQLEITNGEDDGSIAKLIVNVTGPGAPPFVLRAAGSSEELDLDAAEEGMSYIELGKIESSGSTTTFIELSHGAIPSVYDVTVELLYHLVSDKETPITRKMTIRLELVNPFEANYDFSPRLDKVPWPSFFSPSDADGYDDTSIGPSASGLAQKWCLTTRYASFALEPLIIEDISLDIIALNGGITCSASKAATEVAVPGKVVIQPRSIEECLFTVLTRKLSLDDRRSASLDLSLVIKWRRASSPTPISPPTTSRTTVNTTRLPVPRLLVASSEPRVLASVVYSRSFPSLIHLSYTIENPSMHFLTFGVLMSPSESFAFSGPKQVTVQLLPLSRRTLRFALLPAVKGEWVRVSFIVRDRYFQKVLRILVTEGMRFDKEGVMVWVPPDED
jgi:trafficking protein particle complex subunit 11